MKTLKKLFSVSAIVALLGTLAPMYAFGANYSEEEEAAYAYAYKNGITTMQTIDAADMNGSLTRVAMAKMIANYATSVLGLEPDTSAKCTFTDVTAALDAQYDNGVTNACQLGLMGQNITAFRPNDLVTRAEFGTTLSRALNHDSDDLAEMNAANPYYKKHLEYLNKAGIMNNISNPTMVEKRGWVMLMMMRADNDKCSAEEMVLCLVADDVDACMAACGGEEEPGEDEEPVGNAEVKVSRVGSTVDETVAKNAVAKKIGTIKLAAGDEDAVVSSIVISKTGLGSGDVMFEMAKNGVSVSKQATMKTNKNTVTVRFSPVLTVKAKGSETFDILASFDAAENSNFTFAVSDINVANGKSTGTPISLGKVSTTSYSVAEIKDADITVTNGSTQKAGEINKTLATVRVIYPARETRIDGFVITNSNTTESLNDLINNVKAYYNGKEIGKVTVSDEKIVVSDLDLTRANGESISIELKDDCIFVGSTYNIDLDINENDIVAYETSTNERVRSEKDTSGVKLQLNGIDLSINNEITASKTVAPGTSSVELFKAKMTANADFEITDYTITFDKPASITTGMLTTDFTTVTAYINGADYELDLDNKTGWTFDKKDSVNIAKGSPIVIRVVANVKSTTNGANGAYQLHFTATTGRNDNNVNITLQSIDVAGHSTTIANGGFTISRQADTPTNKTVTESTAENMLYFNLRANAEDQILTGLTVSYTGAAAALSGIATKAELMRGNTVVKAVTDVAKLGTGVLFDGISEQLKVDEDNYFTVRITLKGGEVENLGKTGQLYLETGNVKVARAADIATPTVTTSPKFEGTLYSISSNKPSAEITSQDAKNTFVKFTNNSSYYVELSGVTVEMTRNKAEGTAGYVAWSGTTKLLDSVNGTDVSNAGNVPGTVTLSILASYQNLDSALNYVLELVDPANTIVADDYNVIIKGLEYRFVDKTDATKHSEWISETYNVTE